MLSKKIFHIALSTINIGPTSILFYEIKE